MKMSKRSLLLLFLISACITNVTSDFFVFNKNIDDYHSIGFNPSYLDYSPEDKKFKVSVMGGAHVSNNSISLDWINNELLSGKELNNDQEKVDFLSIFKDEDISISSFAQVQLGVNYKDYSFLISPQFFGNILLPYSVIDLTFYGLDFDKNISFDTEKSQFQAVVPITFAHSLNIDKYMTKFNLPVKNVKAGISSKLLLGLAFFETNFSNSNIDSDEDFVELSGNVNSSYSLFGSQMLVNENDYGNSEFEFVSNYGFSGTGFAFDLGISADYSDKINFGISLNNLLGQITWSSSSTYDYNMTYSLNISSNEFEEIADYSEEQRDSLFSSIITYESNNKVTSTKKTSYPSYLLVNGSYAIKDILLSSHVLVPFDNSYYKGGELSVAMTYEKFKKVPLYFQLNFSKENSVKWFVGLDLNLKKSSLKAGFSQSGGFINSAKGISFGISQTIKF